MPRDKVDFLTDQDDRRKFPRFRSKTFLGIPVHLKPLPPFFGEPIQGQMLDLSAGGLSIYIGERLPVDTKLRLKLMFPDRSVLESSIIVRRVIPQKGRYIIGMEFLDLADFQQLKIERHSRDYLQCDDRIKKQENDICKLDCSFYNLCDKVQKMNASREMDLKFQMFLQNPEEEERR